VKSSLSISRHVEQGVNDRNGQNLAFGLLCIVASGRSGLGGVFVPRAAQHWRAARLGRSRRRFNSVRPVSFSVERAFPVEGEFFFRFFSSERDNGDAHVPAKCSHKFQHPPRESQRRMRASRKSTSSSTGDVPQNQVRWLRAVTPRPRLIEAEIDEVMRGVDPKTRSCCSAGCPQCIGRGCLARATTTTHAAFATQTCSPRRSGGVAAERSRARIA